MPDTKELYTVFNRPGKQVMKNPLTKLQCAFAVYKATAELGDDAWERFEEEFKEYVAVMEETVNPYEAACIKFLGAGAMMKGESDIEDTEGCDKWDDAVRYHERLKGV